MFYKEISEVKAYTFQSLIGKVSFACNEIKKPTFTIAVVWSFLWIKTSENSKTTTTSATSLSVIYYFMDNHKS